MPFAVYTPHTMWTSEYSDDNHNEMQRAAHADMSLARLIYSEEWSQNALLTIFNKETGVEVARVNLPEILVSGRNTAEALASVGQTAGTSVNVTRSAGQQILSELARGGLQASSQYVAGKLREVKITLKANHQLLLISKQQ